MTIFTDLRFISENEAQEAADYLEGEFEREKLEFLSDRISFNREAAVWATQGLYYSAQLHLVRADRMEDVRKLIPPYKGKTDISAILSADLSLRFVPQVISVLQDADPEDSLISLLEDNLKTFHYSGIGLDIALENIRWEEELKDRTFRKLYLERIVERKAYAWAEIPYINQQLAAEFGLYKPVYWKELKMTDISSIEKDDTI